MLSVLFFFLNKIFSTITLSKVNWYLVFSSNTLLTYTFNIFAYLSYFHSRMSLGSLYGNNSKKHKCPNLFTCCVLPSGVMCVRSLWQIWQKKRPSSIKSTVWACIASLSSSCCNCIASIASLSSGPRWQLAPKDLGGLAGNNEENSWDM